MSSYLIFNDAAYYAGKVVGKSTGRLCALKDSSITNIEIPSKYNDEYVTELGYFSFGDTEITSIYIPKTIKLIGNAAFYPCTKLKKVKFEVGSLLEKIDINAFSGCTSLEKIDLPLSLKTINQNMAKWPIFKNDAPLTFVSYLGMNSLDTNYVFSNSPKIHVLSNYPYSQIGEKDVTKDGLSCGVSHFKERLTIKVKHKFPYFIYLLMICLCSL